MATDEELAEQLQQGNQVALEALVHRYHSPIYGYVYRQLQGDPEVDDIVQKTFIKVYTHINLYQFPRPFKAWLYRIALNLCRDYWRSTEYGVRSTSDCFDDTLHGLSIPGVASIYTKLEERDRIIFALSSLEKKYQEVLILRFFQELKIKEIADVLEMPEGTVKWRLFQALRLMNRELGEGGTAIAARYDEK